jgi:hypothetical protein
MLATARPAAILLTAARPFVQLNACRAFGWLQLRSDVHCVAANARQGFTMSYACSAHAVFANMLGTLDHLLAKAQQAAMPDEVLGAKLTEDMFSLELQFRVALNQVLLALNQVGGQTVPLEATPYASLAEVRERIAAVRARLDQAHLTDWTEPDQIVNLTLPNGVCFSMSADEDIRDWIMPNFYFHVTMAYALLRHAGLSVGKMDFMPHMDQYRVASA